jgi:hypothetical protein
MNPARARRPMPRKTEKRVDLEYEKLAYTIMQVV